MKKDKLIEFLIVGGEFTKKQLNKMKLDKVRLLFDERFDIEFEDDDISKIEEKEIVIDISKLSVVEQRQYRRTGILPQITINRYTRFDDETPKMDN